MSGDSFHNYDISTTPVPNEFHAYVTTRDLNLGMKYAGRLAVDRAREAGNNPRAGRVILSFDDDGVAAKWVRKENA